MPARAAANVRSSGVGRAVAALEVCAVFACAHVSWRTFKHFTALGRAEVAAGLNFSAGTVMVLFTMLMVLVHGRRAADYGLSVRRWPYLVNIGLIWRVIPVSAAAVLMWATRLAVDPRHAPSPELALISAAGSMLFTVLVVVRIENATLSGRHASCLTAPASGPLRRGVEMRIPRGVPKWKSIPSAWTNPNIATMGPICQQ